MSNIDVSSFTHLVAPEVSGCPDPMIENAVMRAAIKFCENLLIVEELTVNTVVGDRVATIVPTADTSVVSQLLKAKGGDGRTISIGSRQEAMENSRWDTDGKPYSCWIEGVNTLAFDSLPDEIEAVTISVTVKPSRASGEVPAFLLEEWPDEIAEGAKAYLMQVPGRAWSNPQLAQYYLGTFQAGIDRARIKQARGGTNTDLRIKPRAFGQ